MDMWSSTKCPLWANRNKQGVTKHNQTKWSSRGAQQQWVTCLFMCSWRSTDSSRLASRRLRSASSTILLLYCMILSLVSVTMCWTWAANSKHFERCRNNLTQEFKSQFGLINDWMYTASLTIYKKKTHNMTLNYFVPLQHVEDFQNPNTEWVEKCRNR